MHSDDSLNWLFGTDFLDLPLPQSSQLLLYKRWKEMIRLRHKLADEIILNQQHFLLALKGRSPKPSKYSRLPRLAPYISTRRNNNKSKQTPTKQKNSIPLPYGKHGHRTNQNKYLPSIYQIQTDTPKREKRQKRITNFIPSCPNTEHITITPLADTSAPDKYLSRSFGSSDSLDPPD